MLSVAVATGTEVSVGAVAVVEITASSIILSGASCSVSSAASCSGTLCRAVGAGMVDVGAREYGEERFFGEDDKESRLVEWPYTVLSGRRRGGYF